MNSAKAAVLCTMARFLRTLSANCLAYFPSSSTAIVSPTSSSIEETDSDSGWKLFVVPVLHHHEIMFAVFAYI